jgi:hypothetical protein
MRGSSALTIEPGGVRQRAAAGIRTATEVSILALARLIEFVVLFGSALLLPVWPVIAAAILREGVYVRRYRATLVRMTRHILAVWHARPISRMIARRVAPAERAVPERIVGSCTHCGRCCLDRACVFLDFDDQARSHCRIYGKRVWKLLFANCGQYPLDAQEIAVYRCPGFTAVRGMQSDRRHFIPILPATQPAALDTISAGLSETPESPIA